MELSAYRCPEAYPMIKDLQKNIRFAQILLDAFSGPCSELTAICQYIFHHMEAGAVDLQIAQGLRGIAIVEMHHLDLLGECIQQLGMQPRYRYFQRGRPRYWNAGLVGYGNGLRQMLLTDIQGEHEAITHYKATLERIPDPQIQSLIHRIIEDELLHIELLQSYLHRLDT